jgi:hypothetical protein
VTTWRALCSEGEEEEELCLGAVSHGHSGRAVNHCKLRSLSTIQHLSLWLGLEQGSGCHINISDVTRRQWLIPIILATQESEIRRITVQSQPGQIVCETLS